MISFQKTQPAEYACLIDVEYARVSGIVHWALPRFNRRAVDLNEREEIIYVNQTQRVENYLCKQPVGEIDEDAAWKQSRRKKLQAAEKLLTLGL